MDLRSLYEGNTLYALSESDLIGEISSLNAVAFPYQPNQEIPISGPAAEGLNMGKYLIIHPENWFAKDLRQFDESLIIDSSMKLQKILNSQEIKEKLDDVTPIVSTTKAIDFLMERLSGYHE